MDFRSVATSQELTISVVIPVHNGGSSFHRCLKSLERSLRQPDELIVVADGDTDGSWQFAQAFGAQVLRYSTPGGPARARNRGAAAAQGDILFFVDADVTVHPDTLARVVQAFASDDGLDALIGSYDDAPGAPNFLSQYKNLFHHYTHQVSAAAATTFWGACGAVRRSVFEAVGGFDEAYRKPCVEDIELGYRLTQAGYTLRLDKQVQVKHLKRWQPLSLLRAEVVYRALPWTELILSDRQFQADLNLSNTNRLGVVLVFGLVASLSASFWWPVSLGGAIAIALALIALNWDVYRFFHRKRGLAFALRVIPWHWFYFLYGGAAFAYGTLRHFLSRLNLPTLPLPAGVCRSRPLLRQHSS